MPSVFLKPYYLEIKEKMKREVEPYNLGDIENSDALDILCQKTKPGSLITDKINKRVHTVAANMIEREGRIIYGLLNTGKFGTQRPVLNTNTNKVTQELSKEDSVLEPKYFIGFIPKECSRGLFLLEYETKKYIQDILRSSYDRYTVLFKAFEDEKALKKIYKEADLVSITGHLVSKDIAQGAPSKQKRQAEPYKSQLKLTPHKGKAAQFIETFKSVLTSKKLPESISIPEDKMVDFVSVEMKSEGRQRTIRLNKDRIIPDIVIEPDLDAKTNQPTLSSLKKLSFPEVKAIARTMGIDKELQNALKD